MLLQFHILYLPVQVFEVVLYDPISHTGLVPTKCLKKQKPMKKNASIIQWLIQTTEYRLIISVSENLYT